MTSCSKEIPAETENRKNAAGAAGILDYRTSPGCGQLYLRFICDPSLFRIPCYGLSSKTKSAEGLQNRKIQESRMSPGYKCLSAEGLGGIAVGLSNWRGGVKVELGTAAGFWSGTGPAFRALQSVIFVDKILKLRALQIRSAPGLKMRFRTAALFFFIKRVGAGSEDVGDGFFTVGLDSGIADFFGASGTNFISGYAVGGGIDGGNKTAPKLVEAIGLEAAFKYGILDAHSEIFAEFGDFVEAFGFGDIVSDEGEHLFVAAAVSGCFGRGENQLEGILPPTGGWMAAKVRRIVGGCLQGEEGGSGCGRPAWHIRGDMRPACQPGTAGGTPDGTVLPGGMPAATLKPVAALVLFQFMRKGSKGVSSRKCFLSEATSASISLRREVRLPYASLVNSRSILRS